MFLAQRLVFLGEEGLTLQTCAANRADETGVVPGKSQRLQKLVSRFNGKVTTMTAGAEEGVIIFLAVWLSVLQVEGVVADGLFAGRTQEAVHMPGLLQGIDDFSNDLLVALEAGGSEELLIAEHTVH